MAEQTSPAPRRRVRRSVKVSRGLNEARQRHLAQLAEQRDKEKRVDDALTAYYAAEQRIAEVKDEARRKIEPLERAIAQVHEREERLVAEQLAAQGLAALEIHETDLTVEQVGELIGLKEKAARRLIAVGREAAAQAAGVTPDSLSPSEAVVDRDPEAGAVENRLESSEDSVVAALPGMRAVNA